MFLTLCKNEFKVTYRNFIILYALLFLSTYSVASILISQYGSPYGVQWIIMYVAMIIITLVGTEILIIRYYYLSMFDKAAYLTHTLPVSSASLFLSKIVVYSTWLILSCTFVCASVAMILLSVPELIVRSVPMSFFIASGISFFFQMILSVVSIATAITFAHTKYIRNNRLMIGIILYFGFDFIREQVGLRLPDSTLLMSHPIFEAVSDLTICNQWITPLGISITIILIVLLSLFAIYLLNKKMEIE